MVRPVEAWLIAVVAIGYVPAKMVWTVRKYEPMGTTIMAKVKARSLRRTSLNHKVSTWLSVKVQPEQGVGIPGDGRRRV